MPTNKGASTPPLARRGPPGVPPPKGTFSAGDKVVLVGLHNADFNLCHAAVLLGTCSERVPCLVWLRDGRRTKVKVRTSNLRPYTVRDQRRVVEFEEDGTGTVKMGTDAEKSKGIDVSGTMMRLPRVTEIYGASKPVAEGERVYINLSKYTDNNHATVQRLSVDPRDGLCATVKPKHGPAVTIPTRHLLTQIRVFVRSGQEIVRLEDETPVTRLPLNACHVPNKTFLEAANTPLDELAIVWAMFHEYGHRLSKPPATRTDAVPARVMEMMQALQLTMAENSAIEAIKKEARRASRDSTI